MRMPTLNSHFVCRGFYVSDSSIALLFRGRARKLWLMPSPKNSSSLSVVYCAASVASEPIPGTPSVQLILHDFTHRLQLKVPQF
jgi:hypothetical protein